MYDTLDEHPYSRVRALALQLCLCIPARVGSLLNHLPRLMRPLILALQAGPGHPELVSTGLKTLELWVDHLNPEFLWPIISSPDVHRPLLAALTALMQPPPAQYGQDAVKVLGKLGGRNRRFMLQPPTLDASAFTGSAPGLSLPLQWRDGAQFPRLLTDSSSAKSSSKDAGSSAAIPLGTAIPQLEAVLRALFCLKEDPSLEDDRRRKRKAAEVAGAVVRGKKLHRWQNAGAGVAPPGEEASSSASHPEEDEWERYLDADEDAWSSGSETSSGSDLSDTETEDEDNCAGSEEEKDEDMEGTAATGWQTFSWVKRSITSKTQGSLQRMLRYRARNKLHYSRRALGRAKREIARALQESGGEALQEDSKRYFKGQAWGTVNNLLNALFSSPTVSEEDPAAKPVTLHDLLQAAKTVWSGAAEEEGAEAQEGDSDEERPEGEWDEDMEDADAGETKQEDKSDEKKDSDESKEEPTAADTSKSSDEPSEARKKGSLETEDFAAFTDKKHPESPRTLSEYNSIRSLLLCGAIAAADHDLEAEARPILLAVVRRLALTSVSLSASATTKGYSVAPRPILRDRQRRSDSGRGGDRNIPPPKWMKLEEPAPLAMTALPLTKTMPAEVAKIHTINLLLSDIVLDALTDCNTAVLRVGLRMLDTIAQVIYNSTVLTQPDTSSQQSPRSSKPAGDANESKQTSEQRKDEGDSGASQTTEYAPSAEDMGCTQELKLLQIGRPLLRQITGALCTACGDGQHWSRRGGVSGLARLAGLAQAGILPKLWLLRCQRPVVLAMMSVIGSAASDCSPTVLLTARESLEVSALPGCSLSHFVIMTSSFLLFILFVLPLAAVVLPFSVAADQKVH